MIQGWVDFLSVDPLSKEFPWNSSYAYAENSPIENIDLDGLERSSSTRTGRGNAGGGLLTGHGREQARAVVMRMREVQRARQREARRREALQGPTEIAARIRQNQNRWDNYFNNAFASASFIYGAGGDVLISKNQFAGSRFEKDVYQAMLKNPEYRNVVRQVTLVVESSKGTSVRIRIDNVGVRQDGTLDLVEAKFSVYEITSNNVSRTLTLNQKEFFNMLISGDVATIRFVGGKEKQAQIGAISGTEVTGIIKDIQIVTPKPTNSGASNNASSAAPTGNSAAASAGTSDGNTNNAQKALPKKNE
jgi:hypothetical protein